jgi:DNA replication protein DnaC
MNLIELNRALRQLRLGGIAAVLETRLQQAQAEPMAPIDFLSCLVSDELTRRGDRLLERRRKQAQFRDPQVTLDNFDFDFNKKMNRSLVFDLATAAFVARHDDALFLGPPGTGKSHLAQAIGKAVIDQGYRVIYREAHSLLEEIAEVTLDGNRKEHMELLSTVPLLIIDDLGMRKLGPRFARPTPAASNDASLASSKTIGPPRAHEWMDRTEAILSTIRISSRVAPSRSAARMCRHVPSGFRFVQDAFIVTPIHKLSG